MQHQRHAAKRSRGGHDDEDEHIVYYDLDAGSRNQSSLLFPLEDARKNAHARAKKEDAENKSAARGTSAGANGGKGASANAIGILQRPREIFHQQALFQLDADDSDHESEDENPFASLLQQPQRKPQSVADASEDDSDDVMQTAPPSDSQLSTFPRAPAAQKKKSQAKPVVSSRKSTSPVRVTPPRDANSAIVSPGDSTSRSVLRRERPMKPSAAVIAPAPPKRLSVEAADARPSRWSQKSVVSAAAMKKAASRRKSVPNALQRKREALAGGPRRSSLPLGMMEPQQHEDDNASSQSGLPKRRRLADVLMRATLASQQKPQDGERLSQRDTSNDSFAVENDDAIADTEHQMRGEKFETQIFSPSKLHNPSLARKKQQKPNAAAATASKIRGELGEAVARAIRKTTRDLTMLHSHGQTLIEQSKRESSTSAGLDRVQDRDFSVVRLRLHRRSQRNQQQQQGSSGGELTVFDGTIQALSPGLQTPCNEKSCVRVAFSSQTASQLTLKANALVKIYAPFHFIPLVQPAGSSSAGSRPPKWLLVGTTLSEIISV